MRLLWALRKVSIAIIELLLVVFIVIVMPILILYGIEQYFNNILFGVLGVGIYTIILIGVLSQYESNKNPYR